VNEKSNIASHCRFHALSDANQPCFSHECEHQYNGECPDCNLLVNTRNRKKSNGTTGPKFNFWLRDFAMNFFPQKYLETQQEWLGKKGKTIHIDCIFYRDGNKKLTKVTYVTIIENCL
jgi:hypothetical protein